MSVGTIFKVIDIHVNKDQKIFNFCAFSTANVTDECGGACYSSKPLGSMELNDCVLTFTGNKPGGWYAVALQVIINEIKINFISSHSFI